LKRLPIEISVIETPQIEKVSFEMAENTHNKNPSTTIISIISIFMSPKTHYPRMVGARTPRKSPVSLIAARPSKRDLMKNASAGWVTSR
jgi:hypothetical protein